MSRAKRKPTAAELKKLEDFKGRLATGKVFADIFGYFLDHFGEVESFFDLGGAAPGYPTLETCLAGIAQQLYNVKAVRIDAMFVEIPEAHFLHGPCLVNGRQASVIYYSDIDVGLVTFLPAKRGEATQFSRFSVRKLPTGYFGSDN